MKRCATSTPARVAAAVLALASTGVAAVDLSGDEASQLRERATLLIAQRERNPEWDGGTRRVSARESAAKAEGQSGADAAPAKTAEPKRQREPVRKKMKRAVKNMPGALVRNR